MRRSPLLEMLAFTLFATTAAAQFAEPPAYATKLPYTFDSGVVTNAGADTALMQRVVVGVEGAPALRVFFRDINLGPDDFVDVVGLGEGYSHRITRHEVVKWGSSSAFFNGDLLELQLYVAPGSVASYEIDHLLVGTSGAAGDSICFSTDDRVPTVDTRVGRFLDNSGSAACTGWTTGADSCAFSAGHCFPTYSALAEFNVPPSTAGGAFQHPPPEFQFPIIPSSVKQFAGGIGNDYGVCMMNTNALGESAAVKLGYFELGFFSPPVSAVTRISGYGSDSGVANQVLQTHTGPFAGASGFALTYTVDTTGGNSGSPVIDEASGRAIGIHTHGGCGSSGGANSGTSLGLPAFQTTWGSVCSIGEPAVPVASFTASATTVLETQSVLFTDSSTGVPTSWAWDFNEDGIVDSSQKNPSFTYTVPRVYDVTLTVTNSLGSDTQTTPDMITVHAITPAAMPYSQNFQAGLPITGEWLFESDNGFGFIAAGSSGTASPVSGSPSLVMASTVSGEYVTNESKLFLDASQFGGLTVRYYFKETSDEDEPEDGLFISNGVTEVLVKSHQAAPSSWTQFTVDVAPFATLAGIPLDENFHLIFRQRDNFMIGTDGHLIDDVVVTPLPHLDGSVASISLAAGGTQVLSLEAGLARGSDQFWLVGSLSGTSPGTPIGSFVLPLNTPDSYFTHTLLHPNEAPLSNSLGVLMPDGSATASFSLPAGFNPLLAGSVVSHAYVAFDPVTAEVTLVSNAEQVTLLP